MSTQKPVTISHFSDVLCIWAYAAQIRVDELRRQFGDTIRLDYHFLPLFGDVAAHFATVWGARGGGAGYAQHVRQIAARFDHIAVHPGIWTENVPATSASAHVYLKAIDLLEKAGGIPRPAQTGAGGRSVFEEAVWRCRLAFFRDLRDVADRGCQDAIAADMALPLAGIHRLIDTGAAHAALCADFAAAQKLLVQGSPTFLFNEGRQKLYGNVGYRIIEANVQEFLADHGDQASWC